MLTALAFAHLITLRMPAEVRAAATDAHGGFDRRGSLAAVLAISGLFALILFSTFNNLIAVILMGVLGAVFTLREWAWLHIAGIWLYLVLAPFVEAAAEQTVIQQVLPLYRQGRVFGFAMAFESAAAPITAAAALLAFLTPVYRRVSASYARAAPPVRAAG